jgi:copper chaperone CopZ
MVRVRTSPKACKSSVLKVERLSEALRGVVSASIDFGRSLITVNYLPALVGLREIREVLFGPVQKHR